MNFKLTIQYDGTDFHGWQIQGEQRTVQGELTKALSLIEGAPVIVHGSGRTDAGVHAEGQVANVQLQREITANKLRAAINGNVANDVRVMNVETVDDEFHARYSAIEKEDAHGGSVVLNGPGLDKLRDGQLVRVQGSVVIPVDRNQPAVFQVQSIESLTPGY